MPLNRIGEIFRVSCLPKALETAANWQASHVISLIDPELADHHVPVIAKGEHLVVRLRDQEKADATNHFPDIIVNLFETIRPAIDNPGSKILVHCHAGASRSTAFAYGMIAHKAGRGQEEAAFEALLTIVNKPWPNRRIVEILDQAWGRNGAMLKPLDQMRARHPNRVRAWERFNEKRGFFKLYPRYAR